MRVLLVGDTHANTAWLTGAVIPAAQRENADFILQLGDFGWWPGGPAGDAFIETARRSPVPLWWIDGNHEHHDDLAQRRQALRELTRRLHEQARQQRQAHANTLANLAARLHLLAPQNVLERGYSITTDAVTGRILRAAGETRPGQKLRTRLQSGEVRSTVED